MKNNKRKKNTDPSKENANAIGNKSNLGATSTDLNKIRLQTVEGRELEGTSTPGMPNKPISRSEMDNRTGEKQEEDMFDQGSIRSAAFYSEKKSGDSGGKNRKS